MAHTTNRPQANHPLLPQTSPTARGFSLVELLTVMTIIAIIIALTVPALSGARDAARRISTTQLLNDVTNAASRFKADNNRMPGWLSSDEMGSGTNTAVGLTSMENAMLELAGANATLSANAYNNLPSAEQDAYVAITHDLTPRAYVNPGLLGTGDGNYFTPSDEFFIAQTTDGLDNDAGIQATDIQGFGHTAATGELQMPDLIDAWGQPVLAWIDNVSAPLNSTADFAQPTSNAGLAHFYWASNAGMLSSTRFGQQGFDMTLDADWTTPSSLIGRGNLGQNSTEVPNVLAALLGDPAFPNEGSLAAGDYNTPYPTRARGEFIAHSAGADFIPFAANEPGLREQAGGIEIGSGSNTLGYGIHFFNNPIRQRPAGPTTMGPTSPMTSSIGSTTS